MARDRSSELKSVGYEVFILLLSILSVFNMLWTGFVTFFLGQPGPASDVILLMDMVITPVFVFDFLYRLLTAPSKDAYFFKGMGWADLLAVIPMFRIFRVFRVLRVVRLLRTYGPRRFVSDLSEARASATFLITMFLVILVVEFAGSSIYYVERGDEAANILDAGDAVWWSLVTITTVGYGDRYPVSTGGRLVGVMLLFAGIGLFSVLTGFIANVFLAPKPRVARMLAPEDPRAQIVAVRTLLSEQEERTEEIKRRLDELEQAIKPAEQPGGTNGGDPAPVADPAGA